MSRLIRLIVWLAVLSAILGYFAPYVYAELSPWLHHEAFVSDAEPKLAKGKMADDYFAVEDLGDGVIAIGEPRYWQQNYSYLILGERRALLFDAGSGTRDMSKLVATLTSLPVTVLVSHLHYDHLGGITTFDHVAMIDLTKTRADIDNNTFEPGRYEFLGFMEGRKRPSVHIDEWLPPEARIDLGGRILTVLSTPGHTPTSAALFDADHHRLFIGDFMYPTTLYAFLPGASLSAYHETTRALLERLPKDTILWTAHCCRKDGGIAAPWLNMGDVSALDGALTQLEAGKLPRNKGFFPREYPVNDEMTLDTAFPWNNL
jgi:hydroxyacylglutathione hydrolase